METKKDVYEIITSIIIEKLEAGFIPWNKPWSFFGDACNYVTKKPYRGINAMLLQCYDFEAPYFLTFKQAQDLGGNIKKGSKSIPVVFWNFIYKHKETGKTIEKKEIKKYSKEQIQKVAFLRYYNVFNVADVEGVEIILPEVKEKTPKEKIEICENIISSMPQRPTLKSIDQKRAYYSPALDYVNMPKQDYFNNSESYYSVFFHELIHSTGHRERLDRKELVEMAAFGSETYSKEELTAEMGAAFLCGVSGIVNSTIENSSAYIQSWIKKLKDDKKMLIEAAGKAQKAVDFILNKKFEEEESE